MKQNLIDRAEFRVIAGDGGSGAVAWWRRKGVTKGGPDGGDGGNGGSVWLEADSQLRTLRYFAGKDRFMAERGGRGGHKGSHGKNGEDLIIKVPVGTLVSYKLQATHSASSGQASDKPKAVDLDEAGSRVCVAKGGKGGLGNKALANSRYTTPKVAEPGEAGERATVQLELKLLADVGLVGVPNVGKSTLLSVLTAARPEIADYPFTTITPNLGVMATGDPFGKLRASKRQATSLVMADIPGLIEEAHAGKGLGTHFLRHIERCKGLVFVVAPMNEWLQDTSNMQQAHGDDLASELWSQYVTVRGELGAYGKQLLEKPSVVVVNKLDLITDNRLQIKDYFKKRGVEVLLVSAATTEGIEELKERIAELV